MFVLGVWTLASALGCCIGYTITQRSGQYYDNQGNPHDYQWQTSEYPSGPSEYQWQPLEYQWQPLDYQWQPAEYQQQPLEYQWQPMDYQWQPSEYQWQPTENQVQPYGYQSYDYRPVDYQPYYYQPYDYKPYEYFTTPMTVNPASSYSSYYHYYYPTSKPLVPYGYATKPSLPYAEEQKLLQVYRLIRVIVVFRYPVHQPVTSLDLLVHELTDVALQNKLVELLYHVPGYGQVAQLVHDPSIDVKHSFVNDYWRLLLAIQRALNPLDLTTLPDGYLREKLRELRDQANSLTVEQIEAELYQGLPAHAKEAEESNVLENPLGEVEAKEFHENYNAVVEGEDIDEPEEKKLQKPKGEAEILDDLANALEQYLKEQKSVESNHFNEKTTVEQEHDVELTTTVSSTSAVLTTTHAPLTTTPAEETKDSWLSSLIGKGNLLSGHYGGTKEVPESDKLPHPIDVSEPAVLVEPEELTIDELDSPNVPIHGEIVDNDLQDFDIDQRFHSLTPAGASVDKTNTVTHSVPLWLMENAKNQLVENKQLEDITEKQSEDEDELHKNLEGTFEGREGDAALLPEFPENNHTDTKVINADVAGEIPVDGEKIKTDEEDGPSRFNLPLDLSDLQQANTTPYQRLDVTTAASVTSVPTVAQLTTVQKPEVYTESAPVESREESIPQVTQTDTTTEASATSVPTVDQFTTINIHEVHTESAPVEPRKELTTVTETAPSISDLPIKSSDHQLHSSTPETVSTDQQPEFQQVDETTEAFSTPVSAVTQLSTLSSHEDHTDIAPVESREEPISQVTLPDVTTEAPATSVPTVDQLTTVNIHEVQTESAPVESREESTSVPETGPTRYDLSVDLADHQQQLSTTETFPIDEQEELQRTEMTTEASGTPVPAVDRLSPLNVYEVHTESTPLESREEPSPQVTQTATSEPDARRFVKDEILKVLNLLEESNGFTELKERITEQDLNGLVDQLSNGQKAIRWTDMISALQRLIKNKNLENGNRIVQILELWNASAEGHLDDGYFDRTYGKNEPAENRQIQEKIDEVDKEQYKLNNKSVNQSLPLNTSKIHNATHTQLQNETAIVAKNSTTEIHAESRDPRIINVDDNQNKIGNSTRSLPGTNGTSVPHDLQAEEVTDKLEVTTVHPFPVNETKSMALD